MTLLHFYNNQAKILYVLFEKLFIEVVKADEIDSIDIESEEQKLNSAVNGCLARLM